jgi:hypothetical protein
LRRLSGVDHGGFGERRGSVDRHGWMNSTAETAGTAEECEGDFFEHRRTLYCFAADAPKRPARRKLSSKRVGLVNRTGVLIHHVVKASLFFPVAFIFNERGGIMVNRWFVRSRVGPDAIDTREPDVKLIGLHQ